MAVADPVYVGIYPPSADASRGPVTIAVDVYNVVNMQAVEFTVKYDTTKFDAVTLNFTKTITGNCGCGYFFNQTIYESAGEVTVSYALLGQQFSGTGTLAFITFRNAAYGGSTLSLVRVTLVDKNFNAVPFTVLNGNIFATQVGGGGSRVILK